MSVPRPFLSMWTRGHGVSTLERIEEAITPRTKGMIPVHLYGHPADMDEINRIAAANGLWVAEDAAEAPMATYKGRPTGSLGELATFSFYGNKVFTSGEGGALTLSDPGLEVKLRTLKNQGADPRRQYWFSITGYNFRLTNVACAMLCAQLERRADIIGRRRDIFELTARCWKARLASASSRSRLGPRCRPGFSACWWTGAPLGFLATSWARSWRAWGSKPGRFLSRFRRFLPFRRPRGRKAPVSRSAGIWQTGDSICQPTAP